jgi:pimeloyl-ACP methyl ester carboxylesterase
LLPGLGGTGELFAPLVTAIGDSAACHVIAYPPQTRLNYDELTVLVRTQLPARRPFVLLAESFSGPIGLAIAATPPANLRALILCCTFAKYPFGLLRMAGSLLPFLPAARPPIRLLAPFLMGHWRTEGLTQALGQALAQVDIQVLRFRVSEALSVDCSEQARTLQIPALYLQAESDRIVSPRAMASMQRLNPAICAVKLNGPHFLLQCNPDGAWAEIRQFLGSLAA